MKQLSPRQAQQFLESRREARFNDCRSEMEYLLVAEVRQLAAARPRNTRAGWRFEGLPWEQC